MTLPRIVKLIREGAQLDDIQAAAGKLWLAYGGRELDRSGRIALAVQAYWRSRPGTDPYWNFLGKRGSCDSCGEAYAYENLAICPNCFSTYCYRHNRLCSCGHQALG